MKLTKYNNFYTFQLFESILQADSEFQAILRDISGNKTAQELIALIGDADIKLNQNFLRRSKTANDDVDFVNDTQAQRFLKSGEDPFTKTGNTAKIGRVVRQILTMNKVNVTDKDIETFINLYKAMWNKKYAEVGDRIRIVKGEDIRFWYNVRNYASTEGVLGNSCMRYDNCQKYFDIYCMNPDVCSMLIYTDASNNLIARCLIWKLDKPTDGKSIYVDRIYYRYKHNEEEVLHWLRDNLKQEFIQYPINENTKVYARVKNWKFDWFPYIDTLYTMYPVREESTDGSNTPGKEFAVITNDQVFLPKDDKPVCIQIGQTNGQSTGNYGWVWSRVMKYYYKESDCIQITGEDSVRDFMPKSELTYSDPERKWIPKKEAEYSQLYGATYSASNLVDTQWGRAPRSDVFDSYNVIDGKLEDSGKMPKLIVQREFQDKFVYCDCLKGVPNNRGYVPKDKCMSSITGTDWVPIDLRVSTFKELVKVYEVDIFGLVSVELDGRPYQVITQKINTNYQALQIKLKFGGFPIGLARNGTVYSTEDQISKLGLKKRGSELLWAPEERYYTIFGKTAHKEVMSFNKAHELGLEGILTAANDYMKRSDSEYITYQGTYDIMKKYGSVDKYLAFRFAEQLINIDFKGRIEEDGNYYTLHRTILNDSHLRDAIFLGKKWGELKPEDLRKTLLDHSEQFAFFMFLALVMRSTYDAIDIIKKINLEGSDILGHRYDSKDLEFFYIMTHREISTLGYDLLQRIVRNMSSDTYLLQSGLGFDSYSDSWTRILSIKQLDILENIFDDAWELYLDPNFFEIKKKTLDR